MYVYIYVGASLVAEMVKNLPATQETQVRSMGRGNPLESEWQPIPILLPGEFHEQRCLVGYSLSGCNESDTTVQLIHMFMQIYTALFKNIAQFMYLLLAVPCSMRDLSSLTRDEI